MRTFLRRLLYFNTCFLIGGTICEGFRGAALLGSIPLGTGFQIQNPPYPICCLCFVLVIQDVSSFVTTILSPP